MRIRILLVSLVAVIVGVLLRSQAESWSIFETKLKDGSPYTGINSDKQAAIKQASYCLSYGGTAVLVLGAATVLYRRP